MKNRPSRSKVSPTTGSFNTLPQRRQKSPPPRPPDRWMTFLQLAEQCSWNQVTQNSYVISRFWAWFSRVQLSPQVKIPIPRFLSYRDP